MQIDIDLFKFPFEDESWIEKFIIGALLSIGSILIIPAFFLGGYMLRLMRHTIKTGETTLPAWDEWGDMLMDGLRQWVVSLGYSLPFIVLLCCGVLVMVAAAPGMALAEEAPEVGITLGILGWTVGIGVTMLASAISLVISYFMLIGQARLAAHGSIESAFDLREVWRLGTKKAGVFLIAYVVYFGLSFAIGIATQVLMYTIVLACLVPIIMLAAGYYLLVEIGAIYGLAYRAATEGDEPLTGPEADKPLPEMT